MTNKDVVKSWIYGRKAKSKNTSTDGISLYSYNLKIGDTEDGYKIVYNYTSSGDRFISQTTSHHVGIAINVLEYEGGLRAIK